MNEITNAADGDVAHLEFEELRTNAGAGQALKAPGLGDVMLELRVELGRLELSLQSLVEAKIGDVHSLGVAVDAPVDLVVNGRVVGRGLLVAVGDEFGLQITEAPRALGTASR